MLSEAREVNFDGLVGPTHNYSGLSLGNVASERHKNQRSFPRAAARQGLAKMRALLELGLVQGVLPPQERPHLPTLRRLGFGGKDADVLARAAREAPELYAACCSASAMWTANAATVSPSADTRDGRVHLTPANLLCKLHRSLEAEMTTRTLGRIFADPSCFVVHPPLPASDALGDEGAANHGRLTPAHGARGLELFVYGRSAIDRARPRPARFPARQTLEAAEALARTHQLDPDAVLCLQQAPEVIDQGVFHNDVISVANEDVLLLHEQAFLEGEGARRRIAERFRALSQGTGVYFLLAKSDELSVEDAVGSYLFNSQLLSLPGGGMALLAPLEAEQNPRTRAFVERILAEDNPLRLARYIDVRESMQNGGGPACLRLRVVLTPAELLRVHPGVVMDGGKLSALEAWVDRHYREHLEPKELADPALLDEGRRALDELTQLLGLGSLYEFQR